MTDKQIARRGLNFADVFAPSAPGLGAAFNGVFGGAPAFNGVDDPNIFKAVFLAGGPGSGKSFTAGLLFGMSSGLSLATGMATGLKVINSDPAFEFYLKKAGISPADLATMTPEEFDRVTDAADANSPRSKAKRLRNKQEGFWLDGRLGLVYDGTGDDFDKIARRKAKVEALGYNTFMVFVNTSLEVAQARNAARGRKLPRDTVETVWRNVQQNLGAFQQLFGQRGIIIIDNTVYGPLPCEVSKAANAFLRRPLRSPIAHQWIAAERARKRRV
jgi:hypothetical protein